MTKRVQRAADIALLAALYVVTARFGLMLEPVAGFATLVWAPSGLALAALLMRGYGVWPGVAIGAVVANLWAGAPLPVAFGIALGNTLEAVVATYVLRQLPGFQSSLDRLRDVLAFILVGAVLATVIAATIGVSALHAIGIVTAENAAAAWRTWWLGDLIGVLVVAPMILVWGSTQPAFPGPRRLLETLLLGVTVIGASVLIFGRVGDSPSEQLQPYMLFPPLIWAALRFGKRGAVSATFATSVIAVLATVNGVGPFTTPQLYESLLSLQIFMGVLAGTFLILGTSASERRRANAELQFAREKAEGANRAKAEFLAVVSHELRTPLNAISGYAELLTMELGGPLTLQQRDSLERIRRNARHLLSLIDEVLSFARNEAGRLRFTPVAVQVRDAIAEVEPLVAPEIQRKQLTLEHAPIDGDVQVRADPEKLRQILLNMVGNAVKFTQPGGRIAMGADRAQGNIRLWVADTGVGIPSDKIDKVFEPFFQVHGGATRTYPGFGLGLAIARDFARAMGGDMNIDSTGANGTTVSLTLPAAERAARSLATPAEGFPAAPVGGEPASRESPVG